MAVFQYTARDGSGGQTSGTLNSPDRNAAVSELMNQGLTPISVTGDGDTVSASTRRSSADEEAPVQRFGQRRKKPKLQDLANFTRQLANLLKAGMPLTGALNSMTSLDSEGIPKSVCARLLADVREGRTLSMSMGKFPEIFPDMYLNMVKAGESSGSMVEVLKRLADHYERFAEVRQKIISALVYPMFVMGLGFLLIFVFMSYILPKFMTIFKDMKVQLPLSTRILEGMSGFFENWWWLVLIMGGLFVFFLKSYLSSPRGRERFDGWILKAPLISRIVRPNLFGQFSRTLGALLQNGVPVLTALRITESVVQNVVIQQAIAKTREGVTDGKTLAQPLARGGVFPKLLVDLVHIGEQTGDVPAALNNIAETYDNELTVNLRTVTTLIEPILIVFIAGAVAFMLVGVLQAMFTITSTIGR
jgi:type II secretory pathway component PulF